MRRGHAGKLRQPAQVEGLVVARLQGLASARRAKGVWPKHVNILIRQVEGISPKHRGQAASLVRQQPGRPAL